MADTVISDGVVFPQDEGLPNISDGSESWSSAGGAMMLALAVDGGSYVRSSSELIFTGHDGTNNQVDVTGGVAYLDLSGETVSIQSDLGGTSSPAYDTTLPSLPAIMVIVPTTVSNLDVQDATLSDVWLAYATDNAVGGVSAGDAYIRTDDTGSVTAPPHPNVKLGEANPDNAGADVLSNRYGVPTFGSVTVGADTITDFTGNNLAVSNGILNATGGSVGHVQHFSFEADLSNEEIGRVVADTGESISLLRLGLGVKGGGTDANVTLDVYDEDGASVLASVTGGQVTTGSPIDTATTGSDVIIRISNSNSVASFVSPQWEVDIN